MCQHAERDERDRELGTRGFVCSRQHGEWRSELFIL